MSVLFDRLERLFHEGHARPVDGLRNDPLLATVSDVRAAAVLIAVTERDDPGVLLIHRPETMRSHPGQVAFPGGKIDPGEDPITAALREAEEELGIKADDIRIIGQSDPFQSRTGFHITPVLGIVPPDLPILPNPHEVSDWFEAPLRFILDPANHLEKTIFFDGMERQYLEFYWESHRIWGVTAGIISNLARRISHDHV